METLSMTDTPSKADTLWNQYLQAKAAEDALASSQAASEAAKQDKFAEEGISNTSSPTGPTVDVKSGVAVVRSISKKARKDAKKALSNKLGSDKVSDKEGSSSKFLKMAASQGHSSAMVIMGNQSMSLCRDRTSPIHVRKTSALQALKWWENSKHKEGWYNAGHAYYDGIPGVLDKDETKALELFVKAAEEGDVDAMFFVGVREGDVEVVRRAMYGGHADAAHWVALWEYGEGEDGGGDVNAFRVNLLKAAEMGSGDAMGLVGQCYFNGTDGFGKDEGKAMEWWRKGCEGGHGDSCVNVGALMYNGWRGGGVDRRGAFEMYQRGGEMGCKEGWRNAAACLAEGEGVEKCERTAKYIVDTMLKEK
ncbi:hypothetical protein TrCOL_g10215 [Triparma columacea]|uniref:HCP-like protein n=1 Tax=Triparma columacea TaxID=722753 RepID=A0A9W7G7W1_9STRA|nr:hypothetical protein TrCOL_g10215 [Triparma columacea]